MSRDLLASIEAEVRRCERADISHVDPMPTELARALVDSARYGRNYVRIASDPMCPAIIRRVALDFLADAVSTLDSEPAS